jgi:uncharacterized protein YndB with AHSA1/START domain
MSSEFAFELHRSLHVPPARAFEAFTDPGKLAQWWGPQGFAIPAVQFEPRVGNRYRIEMQPPEGDPFFLAGEFRAVDPPHRLAFTFRWEEPDPDDVENVVELGFRGTDETTELSVRQGPFTTEARRALHREGWTDSLDKLEALVRR